MKRLPPFWSGLLDVVRGVSGLLLILAVFGGAGVVVFMGLWGTSPAPVTVPQIRGLTREEAEKALRARGLTMVVAGREYDAEIGLDRVIRSKPYEGKLVKKGRVVEVILSLGPRTVKMPDVVGMTLPAAEGAINDKGLRIGEIVRRASSEEVDRVLEQTPEAGKAIARSEPVRLVVSGGPDFGKLEDSEGRTWIFRRLRITVPKGPPLQHVEVLVRDDSGEEQTVYDRPHRPGEQAEVNLVVRPGWRVRVKLQDEEVFRQTIE
jgi:serine/threonine-protein kinase